MERVAWLYFIKGHTQKEIANMLGVSRSKVARLLKEAASSGIVSVKVRLLNERYYPELESLLIEKFGLKDSVVVPSCDDSERFFPLVVARYIEEVIEPGDIIGVAWGNTLKEVFREFNPSKDISKITVVQLLGGLSAVEPGINPYDIMRYFEGAKRVFLYAPAIVSSVTTKKYLIREPQISRVFEYTMNVNKAFVGIGELSPEASLLKSGFISLEEMELLISLGAVGDILGRYFNINGELIRSPIDERIVGITLQQFKNIPIRIAIARGRKKVRPIIGALHGGFINVLITDYETAEEVIKIGEMYKRSQTY